MMNSRGPCWNALGRSGSGLCAHVVAVEGGDVRRVACSNSGENWSVLDAEEANDARLCGSCVKMFAGIGYTVLDDPPTLPVAGVEFKSRVGASVTVNDDYRRGTA